MHYEFSSGHRFLAKIDRKKKEKPQNPSTNQALVISRSKAAVGKISSVFMLGMRMAHIQDSAFFYSIPKDYIQEWIRVECFPIKSVFRGHGEMISESS